MSSCKANKVILNNSLAYLKKKKRATYKITPKMLNHGHLIFFPEVMQAPYVL
jgi:hypothetical protein